ncbi:hypothetical protein [Fibrella forsythiae]|uniref:Uncharacterized protein n=1 Tax=Fibrella forsythiae TaxID=2817061 RepID=A0ABS3JUY9_9BACT|nr:hypothetical protein [Fibrella forsythiae]MBO0953009.1 hypothetical protein [Fibrella forsythiae]
MEFAPVDLILLAILQEMIADLADPAHHYMIAATYYESQGERQYRPYLYFHRSAIDSIELTQQGMLIRLHIPLESSEPLLIPYKRIWRISHHNQPAFEHQHTIYFNEEEMEAMFDLLP